MSGRQPTYVQKLKDPRWQRKRLEILERAKWACETCGDESSPLHVHHGFYRYGTEPGAYWVRDRFWGEERHAVLLQKTTRQYWARCQLSEWCSPEVFASQYQFGPRIPTAAELVELREKAKLVDWLESHANDPWSGLQAAHEQPDFPVLATIRAAMAKEKGVVNE